MSNPLSYFSGGPSKIPNEVVAKVAADVLQYDNTGVGVLEISHRSPSYLAILDKAISNIKTFLNVPDNFKVLFIPGGGTGQFAAVPLNLMGRTGTADYICTGTWSKYAAEEAEKYGKVRRYFPKECGAGPANDAEWTFDSNASYVYYCDNETIQGMEFSKVPEVPAGVPLVCDMSSNIGTRPIDFSKFGVIYAGAQKNIGCAGITLVMVREDLLSDSFRLKYCPQILDYCNIAKKNSNYNTPAVYAIHVLMETVGWAIGQGGVGEMAKRSLAKQELLYKAIDSSNGFYVNSVHKDYRSRVNVTFTIGSGDSRKKDLETKFVSDAAAINLKSLKGHRDVGGMRASLFNAIFLSDVERLVQFMEDFRKSNS